MYHPNAQPPGTPLGPDDEYELRAPDGQPVYDAAQEASIIEWRADGFERLGFSGLQALTLAMRRDVDRQQVADMIGAGASHAQVMAIVL